MPQIKEGELLLPVKPRAGKIICGDSLLNAFENTQNYAGEACHILSLPELVKAKLITPKNHFIWRHSVTCASEEILGRTKAGNDVYVIAHGKGILNFQRIKKTYEEGLINTEYIENVKQKAVKITEDELCDLLDGRLPDGSEIPVYSYKEFEQNTDLPSAYAIVLDRNEVHKLPFGSQSFDHLKDNMLFIARIGGKEPAAQYIESSKIFRIIDAKQYYDRSMNNNLCRLLSMGQIHFRIENKEFSYESSLAVECAPHDFTGRDCFSKHNKSNIEMILELAEHYTPKITCEKFKKEIEMSELFLLEPLKKKIGKYFGGEGYHSGSSAPDVLEKAKAYVGEEGHIMTLPELIQARTLLDENDLLWALFTCATEEYRGKTKEGEKVYVVSHGKGILMHPERLKERIIERHYGRDKVSGVYTLTDEEFHGLLDGRLPDGSKIPVYSFAEFEQKRNLPLAYVIVLSANKIWPKDFYTETGAIDEQFIALFGGKEVTYNYAKLCEPISKFGAATPEKLINDTFSENSDDNRGNMLYAYRSRYEHVFGGEPGNYVRTCFAGIKNNTIDFAGTENWATPSNEQIVSIAKKYVPECLQENFKEMLENLYQFKDNIELLREELNRDFKQDVWH